MIILRALKMFAHWDGVYFAEIATSGGCYQWDKERAFFPLYPLAGSSIGGVMHLLVGW